jgi:hypothetical protein
VQEQPALEDVEHLVLVVMHVQRGRLALRREVLEHRDAAVVAGHDAHGDQPVQEPEALGIGIRGHAALLL